MNGFTKVQQARLSGITKATLLRQQHGLEVGARVDVFDLIDAEGPWLAFRPFRDVYGAYLDFNGPGIVVNSNHPLSVQRFTAAHELGHFVCGHEFGVDDYRTTNPATTTIDLKEVEANSFAAELLMPLAWINPLVAELGFGPADARPEQIYLLALEMGSSYAAVISQLQVHEKVSRDRAQDLRKYTPKRVKAELTDGERPIDPWADVWSLDASADGKRLFPRIGDELWIELPELPSTGFRWLYETPVGIDLRLDDFEEDEPLVPGAGGMRRLAFTVEGDGSLELRLEYRRPWQDKPPINAMTVTADVQHKPSGDEPGLLEAQKQELLAA